MAADLRALLQQMDRRTALRALGVGVGAAVLSACGTTVQEVGTGGTTGGANPSGSSGTATGAAASSASSGASSSGGSGGGTTGGTTGGTAITGGNGEAVCVLNDNVTRGPYWIDEFDDPNDDPETGIDANIPERSDVTADTEGSAGVQTGLSLSLKLTIYSYDSSTNACTPLPGARVDIWHCNAAGVYSDINEQTNTGQEGRDFLRGYQVADSNGQVTFTTIYPGWYAGRVTHIHLKIRLIEQLADGGVEVPTEATAQLFFADSITAAVYAVAPYAAKGQNAITNATDMVYSTMANPTANLVTLSGDATSGYTATASLGVALNTRA